MSDQEHLPDEIPRKQGGFASLLMLTLSDGSEVQGWWDPGINGFYQRGTDPLTKKVKSWRYQKWENPP